MSDNAANQSEHSHSFVTLDALRGIAALAVVTLHFREFFFQYFNHAYLAVDFFYMLSGFVLAYAYQSRLDMGWRTTSFLRVRLVRLYPMYFAGLVGGITVALLLRHAGLLAIRPLTMAVAVGANLLLLPSPTFHSDMPPAMYPFDYPAWSLFFESVANVVQAVALRRRSSFALGVVIAASFAGLVFAHHQTGRLDFGVLREDIHWGIFRVLFSYCGGMLLYRLWRSGIWNRRVPLPLLPAALLVVLLVPARIPHVIVYDLLILVCVFPVLLMLSASVEPGRRINPAFRLMGRTSYPVYVLHVPIAEALRYANPYMAAHGLRLRAPWTGLLLLVLVVLASLALERWYDLPLRNWLRQRISQRAPG